MAERRQLEFFLLRYVPDAVKDEFVNIGIVMVEPGASEHSGGEERFADVRFTKDWSRVLCLDPEADIGALEALTRDMKEQFIQLRDPAILLHWLEDSFSNLIQLSECKGCLAESPELEIEIMASMYFEPRKILWHEVSQAVAGPHQRILNKMREEWEQAGVWGLIKKRVPVERFTKPGDPFKFFDFGYKVGNDYKLFHAVSLKKRVEPAVRLAYRYPQIADEMMRLDELRSVLTAVIDDDLDPGREDVDFAFGAMKENKIEIVAAAEMPMIAKVAQQELGA